jgi:hypothetical protein
MLIVVHDGDAEFGRTVRSRIAALIAEDIFDEA